MAKENLLVLDSLIEEIIPDGRSCVHLDNDFHIIAYTAGKMRYYKVHSVVGGRVQVEMMPCDLERGRIIFRKQTFHSGWPRAAAAGANKPTQI